jgi:hypothetical protein
VEALAAPQHTSANTLPSSIPPLHPYPLSSRHAVHVLRPGRLPVLTPFRCHGSSRQPHRP